MKKKKCVFAGSFDPITLGHVDVIKKALELFDEVYVLCAVNPDKTYMFTPDEKLAMVRAAVKDAALPESRVLADYTDGYTYEYCLKVGATHIVKGIRNADDFEYERVLAAETKKLCPEIGTVMLEATDEHISVSSTDVRKALENGESLEKMLSRGVIKIIEEKTK